MPGSTTDIIDIEHGLATPRGQPIPPTIMINGQATIADDSKSRHSAECSSLQTITIITGFMAIKEITRVLFGNDVEAKQHAVQTFLSCNLLHKYMKNKRMATKLIVYTTCAPCLLFCLFILILCIIL